MPIEYIAIDWSGAKSGSRKKIWLARCVDHKLTTLTNGLSREEVVAKLIEDAKTNANLVVGLDFAFSLPLWFIRQLGVDRCEELWKQVAENGEDWLRLCQSPFWGRPGHGRPEIHEHYRQTEREIGSVNGIGCKSVFQIGGAGAVGTGSLRGMPFLLHLREEGFSIWPFESASFPCVIEIYPRVLTGQVRKNNRGEREKHLRHNFPDLAPAFFDATCSSEDAFDATVSALVMSRHLGDPLSQLSLTKDEDRRLEGQIWTPASVRESQLSRP